MFFFYFFVLFFIAVVWGGGSFLSWRLIEKTCFSTLKVHFCLFLSLPLFLLSLSWPPTFSISFSLSLSLVLFFLSSFLSFFFALFWFLVFVSLFPFLSSLLLFHERNNIQRFNYKVVFINPFSFFGFLSGFLFQIPFSHLSRFLILSYVFVRHQCFWFRTNSNKKKTPIFGQEGSCNKRFLVWTCVLQNVKVIVVFGLFWANFMLMFKKHYRYSYFNTFSKAKNGKWWPFLNVITWARVWLLSGPSWCPRKKGQVGPDNNCQNLRVHVFLFKNNLLKPIL